MDDLFLAALLALESGGTAYGRVQIAYAVSFGLVIAGAAVLGNAGQRPSRPWFFDPVGKALADRRAPAPVATRKAG